MKQFNNLKRVILIALVGVLSFGIYKSYKKTENPGTVRAFGDLTATYLGVPLGSPIFNINNLLPGQSIGPKTVTVENNGTLPRFVAVKGIRTGPDGQSDPKLENALNLVVIETATEKYSGTLQHFFDQSMVDGILMSVINPGQSKIYGFTASFPTGNHDNDFQNKSVIFDLTFGTSTANHIVINEVYYKVDNKHGLDAAKESRDVNGKKLGINDEWFELYNPTGKDVSLKNWSFEDNSGNKTKLNANKTIKAGGFALVSKDASLWKYWDVNRDTLKIELGSQVGDGLDNNGDHLIMRDSSGLIVDQLGWGSDKAIWNPAVPDSTLGSSIERLAPGFDTDSPSDWQLNTHPSPGN